MSNSANSKVTLLQDYTPPAFWISDVELNFILDPTRTIVSSKLSISQNLDLDFNSDLILNGRELTLLSVSIDEMEISLNDLTITDENLTIPMDILPDRPFELFIKTEINPSANTSLEGLYMSKGMYCTQCEAEGFRKITYYLDRPDVMATYRVSIEGDAPVLLSNGNPIEISKGHATWHDPWPKPCYLFALVAGNLVSYDDSFTTKSGRHVDLKIYVRPGDEDKCAYAMDALKRSMKWDETEYGREYDLDLFMIVAVDDFNMGAMENKGLNIFNSKYVLASPETATDVEYALIEAIIAHEYFHNWTGNRITCRDWFQLSLKEGLTVFRDQSFSGDQRSHAVTRIQDVITLRARQFKEDAGPLAHPVRPEKYIEINNFYTATVYDKGAEVIRMLSLIAGPENYRKALDLYFARFDGQACTIEDWLSVFTEVLDRDLSLFKRWYRQAGTPILTVEEEFKNGEYQIEFTQKNEATADGSGKNPNVIPIAIGLLDDDGNEIQKTQILELTQARQRFTFGKFKTKPTPSILRGFSAPVILNNRQTLPERLRIMAHDTDPYNQWEAAQQLTADTILSGVQNDDKPRKSYLDAMAHLVNNKDLDPAFRALSLRIPTIDTLCTRIHHEGGIPDPLVIGSTREAVHTDIAKSLAKDLPDLYDKFKTKGTYSPDAKAAGNRAFRAALLSLITKNEPDAVTARTQFKTADNMTEQLSALSILIAADEADDAIQSFYDQWFDNNNVMDKWFRLQVTYAPADKAITSFKELSEHPDFKWKNPNRFRSLIGGLAANSTAFHAESGEGYNLVIDWLIKLDPINPQTTARLSSCFENWRIFDDKRQTLAKTALERLANLPNLSKNTSEIVNAILTKATH